MRYDEVFQAIGEIETNIYGKYWWQNKENSMFDLKILFIFFISKQKSDVKKWKKIYVEIYRL
jgi:hypothetical protein